MDLFDRLWKIYDAMAYSADAAEYGKKGANEFRELRHASFFPSTEEQKRLKRKKQANVLIKAMKRQERINNRHLEQAKRTFRKIAAQEMRHWMHK